MPVAVGTGTPGTGWSGAAPAGWTRRPSRQGHGHGTALLRPILDRCDREGVPAYLEASNPRCARLYERLGFTTTGTIRPLGAPPIQLMWRDSVTARTAGQ
jgi:RimJ/RimL family protein N-acetyltransferase